MSVCITKGKNICTFLIVLFIYDLVGTMLKILFGGVFKRVYSVHSIFYLKNCIVFSNK